MKIKDFTFSLVENPEQRKGWAAVYTLVLDEGETMESITYFSTDSKEEAIVEATKAVLDYLNDLEL